MLEVRKLNVTTQKGRVILKDISFAVSDGDKLAVIGEEGNGKTTLLRSIACRKKVEADFEVSGEVVTDARSIGYLEQFLDEKWNDLTPIDFFLKSEPEGENNFDVYKDLGKIEEILQKIGLKTGILDGLQEIKSLSGGEKVKMQLAKLMYLKPDLLLLDEPTNDLDIETLELLEDFINRSTKPVIFISHDETLLERTANCILHLEQIKNKKDARATFSRLGYRDYVEVRAEALAKQDQIATSEQAQRKEQLRIAYDMKNKIQNANPGRCNSMRALKARMARWERTELTQHTDTEDAIKMRFFNAAPLQRQKQVLKFDLPVLKNHDEVLAHDIHLEVVGPEKIVIIGRNGCGKSTLMKQIYQHYQTPPSGIIVSYMPQNYGDLLPEKQTALQFLFNELGPDNELVRVTLGRLKFTPSEMEAQIEKLSGGQKAKIFLTKILLGKANVLLLDEPTRNLSPLSNPVIRGALRDFPGAIISVSHDRKFIDEVCDKVYILDKTGLKKV